MRSSVSYDYAYCADDVNKIQAPKNMQCLSVTSFWTMSNLISMKNSATMLVLHFARWIFSLKITSQNAWKIKHGSWVVGLLV